MAVFAESLEAKCQVENEDVVGAAPTGDAPITSERSTILLPTKVRLILEILRYMLIALHFTIIVRSDRLELNRKAKPISCESTLYELYFWQLLVLPPYIYKGTGLQGVIQHPLWSMGIWNYLSIPKLQVAPWSLGMK